MSVGFTELLSQVCNEMIGLGLVVQLCYVVLLGVNSKSQQCKSCCLYKSLKFPLDNCFIQDLLTKETASQILVSTKLYVSVVSVCVGVSKSSVF